MQNRLYKVVGICLFFSISSGSLYGLTPALYGRIRTLTQQINAGTISEDAARKEVASLNLKSSSSNMNDTKVQELLTVASQHDYKIDDLIVPGVVSAPAPTKSVTTTTTPTMATTTAKPVAPVIVKPTAPVTSQQVEVNESGVISPVPALQKVTVPQNQQVQKPAITQPVQQSQTQFEGEQVIKKLEGVKAGLENVNMLSVLRDPSTGKRIDERRARLAYFTTAFNALDRDTATYSNKFQVTQQNIINTLKKDIVALIKRISDVEAQMLSTEQSQQPISTGTREETTEKVIKDVIKNIQPTATVQKPAVTQPVQQSQQIVQGQQDKKTITQLDYIARQQQQYQAILTELETLEEEHRKTQRLDTASVNARGISLGILNLEVENFTKVAVILDASKQAWSVLLKLKDDTNELYTSFTGQAAPQPVTKGLSKEQLSQLNPKPTTQEIPKQQKTTKPAQPAVQQPVAQHRDEVILETAVQKSRDEKIMPEPVAIISGQAQSDDTALIAELMQKQYTSYVELNRLTLKITNSTGDLNLEPFVQKIFENNIAFSVQSVRIDAIIGDIEKFGEKEKQPGYMYYFYKAVLLYVSKTNESTLFKKTMTERINDNLKAYLHQASNGKLMAKLIEANEK